jgi:hypothetical protein
MLLNVAPLLLNCHLLCKTSTKRTNVSFVDFGYSESTAVLPLPAGRKIGLITQKEPCKVIGLTNPDISEKGPKKGLTHQQFCPFNFPYSNSFD